MTTPIVSNRPAKRNGARTQSGELSEILEALKGAQRGDFGVRIDVTGKTGILRDISLVFNDVIAKNERLARETARVERVVGREGRMEERIELGADFPGDWATSVNSINCLIGDLVQPTTEIARVISAVAAGDLTQKMSLTIDEQALRGEFLRIGTTVNSMVDQLSAFAAEVTRVAKEVGTEGKLGGQAAVSDAAGIWRVLTDNVNVLALNITSQVRNIADVTTSVARGDLSKKITVDAHGEVLELKNTINTMVDQLNSFAAEVTRVAREVGTEGNLGGQADVPGVSGTWKDLTDNVNLMASNLTGQVRNIALVTTAVAMGDLSKKITVDVKGEILELKNTINTMVDQLNSFASEVTRVAREVGTEGNLGGQADVKGVAGTWKDLTDNVNLMATNLTAQVRGIARVVTAVADGDLSQRLKVDAKGEIAALADTINNMTHTLGLFAEQVTDVARTVGVEGKLGAQAEVPGVAGTWKDLTDNVNLLANNLTAQVRNIAKVTTAVANGDLSQKITVDVQGEVLELKNTVNTMVDQLNSFAAEVTRVAREVGSEGKLGGQSHVRDVSGIWKDLTDNVNSMASNLTGQVRNIALVTTAVANGDLSSKITVDVQGEMLELKNTINTMVDQLNAFANQVTSVAREVGIEGKLGGQAKVPGARGTWRQLTDNVNQLAGNLTAQVRAISDVATAVTKGDLTQSIDVKAEGEVAALKDNINQMIINLRETTLKNTEQDWLKTNLAKFSSMMQGQKSLQTVAELIMSKLTPLVSAHFGAFFIMETDSDGNVLSLMSSYAYTQRKTLANRFRLREGLVGQCAYERQPILLTDVPVDYIQISSGLGSAAPLNILVLPVLFEGSVKAVIELASFHPFSAIHRLFLDQLMESIGVVLNMIAANMRTEELLLQSQSLTQELQSQSKELTVQQEELKRSNLALEKQALELEEKARLLAEQNSKVAIKNREVEQARVSVEEKARQLALISKYKSEFLANMSHELRTPLNSILVLAALLAESAAVGAKETEYAKTVLAAGNDLLALIDEILDLSKVEAGKMQIDPQWLAVGDVCELVVRTFQPLADQKGLELVVDASPDVSTIHTDPQRLHQVLKNLLSNAVKFTDTGRVALRIDLAKDQKLAFETDELKTAPRVVSFAVFDTGVGIPPDKQDIIFEAFQQADGNTNRRYGGTGLGLKISREIARLLGGEIHVVSAVGKGSVFTLYIPAVEHDEAALVGPPLPLVESASSFVPRSLAGLRVLLVDDDARNIFATRSLLETMGLIVTIAEDGASALLMLEASPIVDIVLMDIMMPGMDGYEAIRIIRQRWSTLPVIAVTAKALMGDREKCIAAGALDYLSKPIDTSKLIQVIRRWAKANHGG